MTLPTRLSAPPGSRSPPSASAPGRSAAATRRSAGGRRTTRAPREAIARAAELGVNWVDTAAVYGLGTARRWSAGRCGLCPLPPGRSSSPSAASSGTTRVRRRRSDARSLLQTVRRGAEESLRRLGLDSVDLFQIHWPDDQGNPVEAAWQEMLKLRDEGLTRAVGVSNFDVDLLERCEALGHVDSLQPPFNLIGRRPPRSCCRGPSAHGTGVLCYSPMKNGILTDSFSAERVARMAEDDWRRVGPQLPRAGAEPQPGAARRPAAHRRAARRDGRLRRRRLDARVAGRHRRHRRRPRARAGGRLDRRGGAGADGRRPRRDRGGHPRDRRGFGTGRPAPLTAAGLSPCSRRAAPCLERVPSSTARRMSSASMTRSSASEYRTLAPSRSAATS